MRVLRSALLTIGVGILAVASAPLKHRAHSVALPSGGTEQRMVGGYWRVDHSFEPMLIITNLLETTELPVSPILYAADGTEYQLPAVLVSPSGVVSIDIRAALGAAPQEIREHFSQYGSIAISYVWNWSGAASAMVQNRDAKRSLNFNFDLRMPNGMQHGPSTTVREGLWWREDPMVKGFLGLMNVTRQPVNVEVQVLSEYGAFESERTIVLEANETQSVDFLGETNTGVGGIRVTYNGAEKDVAIAAGLESPHKGYSAQIPFATRSFNAKSSTIKVSSVGLMQGKPDPMMKFPSGTEFGIYLALRNITERPIRIIPTVYYMQGTDAKSSNLKTITLAARQSRYWAPNELSVELGVPELNGIINFVLSYQGDPSDLIMANGSIDQTKSYVFEINMKAVGKSQAKVLKDWDVSNGNDTMMSFLNLDEKERDLLITLFFEGGHYKFPLHLKSGGSTMLNASDVVMMGPDSDGNKIPPGTSHGTAILSGNAGYNDLINVGVSIGVFNVSTATCGNRCPTCLGATAFRVQADKGTAAVGQTAQFSSWELLQSGAWVSASFISSWSSDNIQVAKPGSTIGGFVGVSPGTFHAQAEANLLDINPDCAGTGAPCPFTTYQSSANGTIYQPVPSGLAILPPDATTPEAACPTGGCGVSRHFTYQVLDQTGLPLQTAGLQVWDAFGVPSPNPLNITGFKTTCTPANTGPCGVTTNALGQFLESNVGACAPACQSKGVCIAGGPSVVTQTYHVGTGSIRQTVQLFCSKTIVNGQ